MKSNLNKKQTLTIAAVVGIGALLAALILGTSPTKPAGEESSAEQSEAAHVDGPGGHKEGEKQAEAGHVDGPGGHKEGEKQAEAGHVDGPGGHKEDEKQAEGRVTMSDAQLKQSGVTLLTAGPTRINTTLKMIGEIRLNEDRISHVVPLLMGVITASSANAGDRVRKGQLLAVISSQALADQRSELLAAQKRLALARTTNAREKKLWEEKISAEQDYLQAKNAMQEADIAVQNARQKLASLGGAGGGGSLTRYEIRSPIDGVVVEKHLSLGEAVQGDAKIFVIADLSTVWAEMTVPAKDLPAVRIGQTASIKATAFAAEASGKVTYVGALVGEQTRAAKARVVLPNPQNLWRPGMQVNVDLVAGTIEVPVAVASQAIQTLDKKTVVFGRSGEYFEARPLELGRTDGKFVEVVSGLNAGEMYAAANSFLIKADLEKSGASHDH